MTKQEEIREGIDRDIEFTLMAVYYAGKTGESISESVDTGKVYLKKALHSQGVVIKIDKELEPVKWIRGERQMAAQERTQQDMLKAGYVATKPIIEL